MFNILLISCFHSTNYNKDSNKGRMFPGREWRQKVILNLHFTQCLSVSDLSSITVSVGYVQQCGVISGCLGTQSWRSSDGIFVTSKGFEIWFPSKGEEGTKPISFIPGCCCCSRGKFRLLNSLKSIESATFSSGTSTYTGSDCCWSCSTPYISEGM